MKDKILKLLEDVKSLDLKDAVDVLIQNGIVLTPVNVGQTVWYIKGRYYTSPNNWKAEPIIVTELSCKKFRKTFIGYTAPRWSFIANGARYNFDSIGKRVFLTKQEANLEIKKRCGNKI